MFAVLAWVTHLLSVREQDEELESPIVMHILSHVDSYVKKDIIALG